MRKAEKLQHIEPEMCRSAVRCAITIEEKQSLAELQQEVLMSRNRISRYLSEIAAAHQPGATNVPAGFVSVPVPPLMAQNPHQLLQQQIYELAYRKALEELYGDPGSLWYSI